MHGAAGSDSSGAYFGRRGDYTTVQNFGYANDAAFSISFWSTEVACSKTDVQYIYSHARPRPSSTAPDASNINIYVACGAQTGQGSAPETVIGYNLKDASGTRATVAYALRHSVQLSQGSAASAWVHIVLRVGARRISTFVNGHEVLNAQYSFLPGIRSNVAYPYPGRLSRALGGFKLDTDIHLGAPAAIEGFQLTNRYARGSYGAFNGRIAGLVVSDLDFTSLEVECLFKSRLHLLPVSTCKENNDAAVAVSFIRSAQDSSEHKYKVTVHGGVNITGGGAQFDGVDDYVTIQHFDYASRAEFSVAMWFTKSHCTDHFYEYLYSHHGQFGSKFLSSAHVDIFIACEGQGSGYSTADGTVVRYFIRDDVGAEASFDYALHDAGDFDAITNTWVHIMLSVTPSSLKTYADGVKVTDDRYYHFKLHGANVAANPGTLTKVLSSITLNTDIFLGARADKARHDFFAGKLALFNIFDRRTQAIEAQCIFRHGENTLPGPEAKFEASGVQPPNCSKTNHARIYAHIIV